MGLAALAAAALLRGAAAFAPFAGVDELRPQRLHAFCEDGATGLRWCSHSVQRALEDGGDVQMSWGMRVDPDHILSLDTEAEHGVRLAECSPRELRLELPESHARHAAEGKFVVGSRFAHGCQHLEHRPLYHRIKEVKRHEWRNSPGGAPGTGAAVPVRFAHVHLSTEELPSLAHIAPSVSFSFSYVPAEARDVVGFPEMRTDFGANRPHPQQQRRLFGLDNLGAGMRQKMQNGLQAAKAAAASEFGEGGAAFQHESGSTHSIHSNTPDLNMAPKQVSNFGWNWNFFMNTTEEPEFNLTAPGAKGMIKVREPYIKAHAGIYLNFSSEFKGLTESPRVRWTAGLHGHGRMQARVLSMMNTTDAVQAEDDEGTEVDLPFLEKFHNARWFDKIDIAAGSMPISFEPGIRFNSKMYHKGAYDGAIAVGGRTHGIIHPQMTFDSETGLDTHFEGELLDTDIWPPMWMIFTRRFELGLMATPTLLMRGDFAGVDKATLALEMHPYLNITVRRDDEKDIKPLVVYPTRAMGLPVGKLGLQYKLAISANGQLMETRPRSSWGQVVFHDGISDFALGNVSRLDLPKQIVTLVLIQVDTDAVGGLPAETTLGSGVVVPGSPGQCAALESGGCRVVVSIQSDAGEDVAAVEVAVIWHDKPAVWLASRVRGVAVSVSALMVEGQSTAVVDAGEPLSMRILQGGSSYAVGVSRAEGGGGRGDRALEFGPGFVGGWEPCWSPDWSSGPQGAPRLCETPRVELYRGGGLVGAGDLPATSWAPGANGTATVLLHSQSGEEMATVGAIKVQVRFAAPTASSMVLAPSLGHQAAVGSSQEVVWTVSGAEPTRDLAFRLSALRLDTEGGPGGSAAAAVAVGGRGLLPVPTEFWSVAAPCSRETGAGGAAPEYAPCTFAHSFMLHNESFSAGDVVAVQIEWEEDGATRTLLSPPVQVVAEGSSVRRLGAMEAFNLSTVTANLRSLQDEVVDWGHHLFDDQEAWDEKVQANEESCNKRDLRFYLGAGMLGRAKLESFQMGSGRGLPPFPGGIATPLQSVARLERGTDTRSVLPDELCADGLCSGALPGCSQDGVKKHYPRLTFNFSRPFHYNKSNKATMELAMQQVMAYAFSALPEAVNVAIKELNRSHRKGLGTTSTTTSTTTSPPATTSTPLATKEPLVWGQQESSGSTPGPDPVAAPWGGAAGAGDEAVPELPSLAIGAGREPEEGDGAGGWWPWGGRRLRDGRAKEPDQAHAHQIVVQFRDGLPYQVDRALVERMVRHGFFMDLEDGASATHGPLSVVNFNLELPDEEAARLSTEQKAAFQLSAGQKGTAVVAMFAVVLGSALVAVWVARRLASTRRREPEWWGIPDGTPTRGAVE